MSAPVFEVPLSVGSAMANAAGDDVVVADFAFGFWSGAEWFAAGMAVCAFLEDLARIYDEERCLHGRPRPGPGIRLHEACIDCWNELPF